PVQRTNRRRPSESKSRTGNNPAAGAIRATGSGPAGAFILSLSTAHRPSKKRLLCSAASPESFRGCRCNPKKSFGHWGLRRGNDLVLADPIVALFLQLHRKLFVARAYDAPVHQHVHVIGNDIVEQ